MTDQIIPFGGSVETSPDNVTWTEVPEAKGMPVPATTTEFPEVTSLDSPSGFREFITGLKDAGEVSFTAGYTPAGYNQMSGLDAALTYFRVTFPLAPSQSTTGDVFTFTGYPTTGVEADDVGAPINMNVSVRITGAITWVQGS